MAEEIRSLDRTTLDRQDTVRELERPRPQPKEGRSPFDQLLEQAKLSQKFTTDSRSSTQLATQQGLAQAESRKDRERENSKERDKEEGPRDKEKKRGHKEEGGVAKDKVVAKSDSKNSQGDSHGSQDKGFDSSSRRKAHTQIKKIGSMKTSTADFEGKLRETFRQVLSKTKIPRALSQEILQWIVKSVRIGINGEGAKEIQCDLAPEIFKGLRLRVAAKNGKVAVTFGTGDEETRRLFLYEAPKIRKALEEAQIAVETINVI